MAMETATGNTTPETKKSTKEGEIFSKKKAVVNVCGSNNAMSTSGENKKSLAHSHVGNATHPLLQAIRARTPSLPQLY